MIRNYIKAKKAELRVKAMFYGMVAEFIDNQSEIVSLIKNLTNALKDVPPDELRSELIGKMAEIIHDSNNHNK